MVRHEDTNEILVKVGRTGGRVEEYSLEGDEPTVEDALQAAGITLTKGERIRLNGETADEGDSVDDGDIITVDIVTPNFDGGVRRRKQLNALTFIADQTVGSMLQVRKNDNDYEVGKWSNFRNVDLSKKKPMLTVLEPKFYVRIATLIWDTFLEEKI